MKRNEYTAVVFNANRDELGRCIRYAWNSAIKATESIMRDHAYATTTTVHGGPAVAMGERDDADRIYRRAWTTTTGREFTAMVWKN